MAEALRLGTIDVAELCSTQPDILVNGWVVLAGRQADPAGRQHRAAGAQRPAGQGRPAGFEKILNDVSAKIDTATLADLGKQVSVDNRDIAVVAKAWLQAKGLAK